MNRVPWVLPDHSLAVDSPSLLLAPHCMQGATATVSLFVCLEASIPRPLSLSYGIKWSDWPAEGQVIPIVKTRVFSH